MPTIPRIAPACGNCKYGQWPRGYVASFTQKGFCTKHTNAEIRACWSCPSFEAEKDKNDASWISRNLESYIEKWKSLEARGWIWKFKAAKEAKLNKLRQEVKEKFVIPEQDKWMMDNPEPERPQYTYNLPPSKMAEYKEKCGKYDAWASCRRRIIEEARKHGERELRIRAQMIAWKKSWVTTNPQPSSILEEDIEDALVARFNGKELLEDDDQRIQDQVSARPKRRAKSLPIQD